jgi:hypothetical protein
MTSGGLDECYESKKCIKFSLLSGAAAAAAAVNITHVKRGEFELHER